ncbi:helix-turn-helix domain-containing protein [Actinopolymorpha rutila]|uniref:Transcriptional regulator with XRE-family HTH domain n=1 Tax=Actinopolymorpha rutila TaxID=446787 RepID=A0A852ZVY7_9ACTN|nr:helix-turn-helix transcriptional regulator [Actinopolymorpha rutila]NYH92856.1 transcriptional regulator with XRE-family HTH domain [Actinopolymorpha rutila]
MVRPVEHWLTQPDGLAPRLRAARMQAGLQGKELAAVFGWQPSKVSRIENGKQMPSDDDIRGWLETTGAPAVEVSALLDLAATARAGRLDWRRRFRAGQAAVQANYNQIVADSRVVKHFETVYVPGLLQIADYAHVVIADAGRGVVDAPEDLTAAVATRMARQQHLYDPARQFEFLLAEPVLRWLVCPPSVMRAQLDRLHTVIGMPNVRFGILPLGTPLATIPQNSFQLFDDLAVIETFVGETTYESEPSSRLASALDSLWDDALEGERARDQLVRAVAALPD